MCLPNFIQMKNLSQDKAVTGYRNWKVKINEDNNLKSEYIDYIWITELTSHEVREENSGIYSYCNYNYYNNYNNNYYNNNYYNNYYNYNYNNNYNNYNNNYYNNNYYNISGIIKQFGKIAIHKIGYRSEYAIIDSLFTIRESDAKGDNQFINWIKEFNKRIEAIAMIYNCKTIYYQDFIESMK